MKYRPEVDGLRAIAVSAVILYHAGLTAFCGGFLGVDIFFVISGYLITGIIAREVKETKFSIFSFYERRIRRILPALNVMMLLCIPVAAFLLLPDDLENFGQSLIATALFANNILLLVTTGYFALEIQFKPLMHTWSLGVEEHYYIVIPILIWAAYKLGRWKSLIITTALVSLASFAFCLWAAEAAPSANFYLVLSRAWELGAGGLVALVQPMLGDRLTRRPRLYQGLASAGLVMTVAPLFILNGEISLPSWPTLVPIAGVCLLLLFARQDKLPGKWLAARPVVFVGLLSYSAYLYHQPVFVFARVANLAEPSLWLMLALIVPVFILAYLSWRFVEKPFRDRKAMPIGKVLLFVGVTTFIVVGAGAAMYLTSGFYRYHPELAMGDPGFGTKQNAAYNKSAGRFRDLPLPAQGEKVNVLVLGNSFARDFINMGLVAGNFSRDAVSYGHIDECEPLPPLATANAAKADYIVFASNFTAQKVPCLEARVRDVRAAGKAKVVVLGTKNFGWNNNAIMLLPAADRYRYHAKPLRAVTEANDLAQKSFGADYVNLMGMIEDDEGRVPVFTPDRKFISQDRSHLTQAGAAYVGSILFQNPDMREIADAAP